MTCPDNNSLSHDRTTCSKEHSVSLSERAAKIIGICAVPSSRTIEAIESELKTAVQEAFEEGRRQGAFECRHAKDIALEKAAQVAEAHWKNSDQYREGGYAIASKIMAEIRALKASQ